MKIDEKLTLFQNFEFLRTLIISTLKKSFSQFFKYLITVIFACKKYSKHRKDINKKKASKYK